VTRSSSKPSEPPSGKGKPTGALAGVHPVDSISRDVRPALGADLTALDAATALSHPDNVVRRHAR
jgi:hypothetical protein